MILRKERMLSKSILLLLQFVLILFQFQDALCKSSSEDINSNERAGKLAVRSTIFDSRVLNRVKTLFTRNLQADKTTSQTGQKKSIITTADVEKPLRVKIDPRQFGNTLLNQANENAARKSDIFMNKAIDATALGVAVLKLIFGKDAKMVMKDSNTKSADAQASLRTSEPRPAKITSWIHSAAEAAERKSKLARDRKIKSKGTDHKIGKLSMNILKLVKSLQPTNAEGTTENGKTKDHLGSNFANEDTSFSGRERNLGRLLSLMEKSKANDEKGNKKSWVLLKVPSKQPTDELGMLNDPAVTEENSNDESSEQDHTDDIHKTDGSETHSMHRKKKAKESHEKESKKGLMIKIEDQVKHLADIVRKQQNNEKESVAETKHHKPTKTVHTEQSYERKAFTTPKRVASKTLKSEPVQEVNAVKTDTTTHASYENSVNNLLTALETSAHKHSLSHVSRHLEEANTIRPQQRKVELVPSQKKEEDASSKDVVSGAKTPGGTVVSLDALRQLGQLLGLSSQQSEQKKISPYTGTEDTLTLATAMPPKALEPTPTSPPPPPPPSPTIHYEVKQQNSLNRISEQLKMFAERGLRGHNDYRKLHQAEPLKWSEDLASAAEKLAYQAAKKGTTRRSELVEQKGYGENVAKIPKISLENAGEEATRHWYNEKEKFTFSDPVIDEGTKAFTQIIWKGTRTLGMGAAKDDDTGELYVVALYSPKGNDQATLRENLAEDGGKQNSDVYASIFKKRYVARH